MEPNFCGFCGHRTFQHGSEGCEHVDISQAEGVGDLMVTVRTSCDCDIPYPQLIDSRIQ